MLAKDNCFISFDIRMSNNTERFNRRGTITLESFAYGTAITISIYFETGSGNGKPKKKETKQA